MKLITLITIFLAISYCQGEGLKLDDEDKFKVDVCKINYNDTICNIYCLDKGHKKGLCVDDYCTCQDPEKEQKRLLNEDGGKPGDKLLNKRRRLDECNCPNNECSCKDGHCTWPMYCQCECNKPWCGCNTGPPFTDESAKALQFTEKYKKELTPLLVCKLHDGDEICAQWCYRVLHKNGGNCINGRCICKQ